MKPLVSDALWEHLQPLFPPPPPRRFRFPGRKPLDYRKVLTGILFVLKTGIAWDNSRLRFAEDYSRPFVTDWYSLP